MGFTADTPTVAGVVLIRSSIQSPNYVAGVSGWTINQDGSVEFNNATFRGTVIVDGSNNSYITIDNPGGDPQIILRPDDIPGYPLFNAALLPGSIRASSNDNGSQATSNTGMRIDVPGLTGNPIPFIDIRTRGFTAGLVNAQFEFGADPGTNADFIFNGSLTVLNSGLISSLGDVLAVSLQVNTSTVMLGSLTVQGIQPGRPPVVRLAQKVAQAIPNAAATAVTYAAGSEELKLNGSTTWHNVAVNNTRVTPTISGIYEVRVTTSMDTAAGGNYTQVAAAVGKNGTRLSPQAISRPDTGTPANTTTTSAICLLNGTTDYVEHYATQNNSGAANQNTNVAAGFESVMELVLIGI